MPIQGRGDSCNIRSTPVDRPPTVRLWAPTKRAIRGTMLRLRMLTSALRAWGAPSRTAVRFGALSARVERDLALCAGRGCG